MEKSLIKLTPFDQYSRQYQVAELVNSLRTKGEKFKILDVGGYKGKTADFLPKDDVVVMDLFDVVEDNYVKGSALEMPFDVDSFDFIVSFDVLEHIEEKNRRKFVEECNRVAKRGIFICAPHKSDVNEESEAMLNKMYKKLHGKDHEWLKEHIDYTIPDFNRIEQVALDNKLYTKKLYSNKTYLWVTIQQAIFLHSKYPMGAPSMIKLNEFYNKNLKYDGGPNEGETYRIILCCLRNKNDLEKISTVSTSIENNEDDLVETKLLGKIGDFYLELVEKMAALSSDYKNMYIHERNRAIDLENNNKDLWERVNNLENRTLRNRLKQLSATVKKTVLSIRKD